MDLSTSTHVDAVYYWTEKRERFENKSAIDHLFNRLDGMYPGKWAKNFPNEVSIQNWKDECVRTFAEDGIKLAALVAGLRECRRRHPDWPPSVPELANACNPPVDPVAAYHEAVAGVEARNKGEVGVWSHPAIYWAAAKLGRDLMSQPGAAMKERWAAVLKAQLARGEWEQIPAARVLLDAPGPSKLTKEEAADRLAKLGAANITKTAGGKFDHLRWARAMLELEQDQKLPVERRKNPNRPPLTLAQIKAARQALGVEIQPIDDETDGQDE